MAKIFVGWLCTDCYRTVQNVTPVNLSQRKRPLDPGSPSPSSKPHSSELQSPDNAIGATSKAEAISFGKSTPVRSTLERMNPSSNSPAIAVSFNIILHV